MNERDYLRGNRAAWRQLLDMAVRELVSGGEKLDAERLLLEREEAIAVLRSVCEVHGDNDWEPNLHLGDIIDKHLVRHLDDRATE